MRGDGMAVALPRGTIQRGRTKAMGEMSAADLKLELEVLLRRAGVAVP